jgi:hypothetical protein
VTTELYAGVRCQGPYECDCHGPGVCGSSPFSRHATTEPSLPAGHALTLVAIVAGLVVWHMRRPQLHALEGAIFVGLVAIVWLGVSRAH